MSNCWIRVSLLVCALVALPGCVAVGWVLTDREKIPGDVPMQHFTCESKAKELSYCDVDASAGVRLSKQLSTMPCIKGRTWDYGRFGVWVDHGCRGEFISGAGGDDQGGGFDLKHGVVRCESNDQERKRCPAPVTSTVELLRQLSDTECVEGQTWGSDAHGVWVDGGCRGLFRVR